MNCINHPERPRIAFCQNCGKPLCAECARVVGSAVFDEACLVERLSAANAAAAAAGSPGAYSAAYGSGPTTTSTQYEPAPGGGTRYTVNGTVEGVPYVKQGVIPPAGAPNPGLALLLGFIPGVGAMYNGQYAKGVVHLVVFAVLVSLGEQHSIFGLFVTGWIFYQAIEAYHTAKARRDGTPLPNPFGLNDLGERLGFGKAWGANPATGAVPVSPATPPAGAASSYAGAPSEAATQGAGAYTPYTAPFTPPTASYAPPGGAAPAAGAGDPQAAWGAPPASYSYTAVPGSFGGTPYLDRRNRFPVGALVLIGLGLLFLIGNAGWVEGFPIDRIVPFLLIGLGVWIFVRRMLDTGAGLADDGSPEYRLRLYRALRGSVWVILVGILFLLDSFNILSWGRSWPLFIIVGGLVAFFERSAFTAARVAAPFGQTIPVAPAAPSASAVPAEPSAVIVSAESGRDAGEV